jgi:ribose/xylose/arabinose/galactoside ABC-type transport system permease subunit
MDVTFEEAIGQRVHRGMVGWLASRQTFWVFLAALTACVALTLATDTFATERNLFNVTRNFAFVGIVALGMTAVIITAGIDLSVGSVVVLSGMVTGMTMAAGYSIGSPYPWRSRRRSHQVANEPLVVLNWNWHGAPVNPSPPRSRPDAYITPAGAARPSAVCRWRSAAVARCRW